MVEPGSRETAVVTLGRVALVRDARVHELARAVSFDADLPHRFENAGEGEATFFGRGRRAEEKLTQADGAYAARQDLGRP